MVFVCFGWGWGGGGGGFCLAVVILCHHFLDVNVFVLFFRDPHTVRLPTRSKVTLSWPVYVAHVSHVHIIYTCSTSPWSSCGYFKLIL